MVDSEKVCTRDRALPCPQGCPKTSDEGFQAPGITPTPSHLFGWRRKEIAVQKTRILATTLKQRDNNMQRASDIFMHL